MIFLSYNWSDGKIADQVEARFKENNLEVTRDIRHLEFRASIKDFMKKIRMADFVVMIISPKYLKSKNCMFEVLEFVKDESFRDRIIPMIISDEIFITEKRVEIVSYWNEEKVRLKNEVKKIEPEKSIPILKEIKMLDTISNEVADFLDVICDMNNIVLRDDIITNEHFNLINNFVQKSPPIKYVLSCDLRKIDFEYQTLILTYLKDFLDRIEILHSSRKGLSLTFESFVSPNEIEKNIQLRFDKLNVKNFNVFKHEEAYYIIAKRKVEEYVSKEILWWSHLQEGYSADLNEAGIYSLRDIEEFDPKWFYEDQLAIKCLAVDQLNINVFPINSFYSRKLVRGQHPMLGEVIYEGVDYFN